MVGWSLLLVVSCDRVFVSVAEPYNGYSGSGSGYRSPDDYDAEGDTEGYASAYGEDYDRVYARYDPCEANNRCNNINTRSGNRNCACDDLCHIYGDCCADKSLDKSVTDAGVFNVIMSHYGSCTYTEEKYDNVFVVDRCPPEYSMNYVKVACEELADDNDILLQVPVSETRFGIVFSNMYCAICHGWSRGQITFWTVLMDCTMQSDYDYDYEYPLTPVDPLLPSGSILGGGDPHTLDHAGIDNLYENSTDMSKPDSGGIYFTPERKRRSPPEVEANNYENLTVGEIYQKAEVCEKTFKTPNNISTRECTLNIIRTCAPGWGEKTTLHSCIDGYTAYVYDGLMTFKNKHCAICNHNNFYSCNKMLFSMDTERAVYKSTGFNSPNVVSMSILLDFNRGTSTIGDSTMNSDKVVQSKSCQSGYVYDLFSANCRPLLCGLGLMLVDHKCMPDPSKPTGFNHAATNQTYMPQSTIELQKCPKLEVNKDNYISLENHSVFINATNTILEKYEYVIHNNQSILICASNFSQNYTETYEETVFYDDIIQGVISLTGQIVSVIALFILLLIYGTNKTLRTIPGKCLMALSFSLFWAQLLFVLGMFIREFYYMCKVSAILTHYFFLASFFWMNVMAFDVWRTFHNLFMCASKSKKHNKFTVYCVYSFVMPAVVVGCGITLDSVKSVVYGNGVCWITDKYYLLYAFAIPVFILLLINIIWFILAAHSIYKASTGTEVLRKSKTNAGAKGKRLVLYIKLSIVMGLTWVFGFIASLIGSTVLWYLFVIFNTLQGLFICLGFACNRKVFRLVKAKIGYYSEQLTNRSSEMSTKQSTVESSV